MSQSLMEIVREGVIESIFERGWVEQTPDEFFQQVYEEIAPELKRAGIQIPPQKNLRQLIFQTLAQELDDEYDVNIYRLKFFPSEHHQTYDA